MRVFDYSKLKEKDLDNEILAYVAQIHEYKGKQDLYLRQKPVELNRLIEIAKIQSAGKFESDRRYCDNKCKIKNSLWKIKQRPGIEMKKKYLDIILS